MSAGERPRKGGTRGSAARDPLGTYRDKRDPSRSNEPFAAARPRASATLQGRFVVHLHAATRRHFDLRLEIGSTLKSFAVPRGPSLDPKEKRLAMNTEDHPLEYLEFEDVIPEGNYGAGPMIVWDRGRVRYLEGSAEEGLARGKLDFELAGFKLRGRFALVHSGARRKPGVAENQWLLLKKEDAFSAEPARAAAEDERSIVSGLLVEELDRRAEISIELEADAARRGAREARVDASGLGPMLCSTGDAPLDDPGWIYELKLDGARILAQKTGPSVALRDRPGRLASRSFPEIVSALAALPAEGFVLDGEIVAFDEHGRPSFQRLASRLMAARPEEIAAAAAETPVVYVVFDLLALGSRRLTDLPLVERKALLERLVRGRGLVRALDHIEGSGQALYDLCRAEALEGIVAKRASSRYQPGKRSPDWVKVKCERDEDFVVVGWEAGRGSRAKLGALRLASRDGDGWVLRGKVGSGLGRASLRELEKRLTALEIETCPAAGGLTPSRGEVHHARPELVVSVRFSGWTDDGMLRAPVFRGVRDDLEPESCTVAPPAAEALDFDALPAPGSLSVSRVAITNPNKVFWPAEGYTKRDLAEYYAAVAPVMLPFLRDRPVLLVRYPDGIEGKSFYQWRPPPGAPSWLKSLELRDDEPGEDRATGDKSKNVFLLDDLDALLYVVNLGCIPIHVLASRSGDLESGDFFTVDFDVGRSSLREAVTLGLTLRELLSAVGLVGYPKTSGQTGLHVLVPVGPGVSFDTTRTLAELFGRLLELRHPKLATTERRIERRGARVFVDTGQTGRSRAIVAPYSVRAVAGATVSTPLAWEELHSALDPRRFDIVSVPQRVAERGDPMSGLLDERPDMGGLLARIEGLVKG